jgi:hypothetical protein
MKTTLCFSMILLGLASLPALAREQAMPSVQASQLNCQPPSTAPAATAGQDQFDQYSWQMFIALS